MMHKDTIVANITSAGALAAVWANLETGLTILVLLTALIINIRKLFKKEPKSSQN